MSTGNERVDIHVFSDGATIWGDVTVAEPANRTYLPHSCSKAGYAIGKVESSKRSKWLPLAPAGVVVQPLAMESTGRVAEDFVEFLRGIERQSNSGPSCASMLNQLSVTCMKQNVACLCESMDHVAVVVV